MNTVFYMLRNEFEADESYTGSDIMAVILKTIKVRCCVWLLLSEQMEEVKQCTGFAVFPFKPEFVFTRLTYSV